MAGRATPGEESAAPYAVPHASPFTRPLHPPVAEATDRAGNPNPKPKVMIGSMGLRLWAGT